MAKAKKLAKAQAGVLKVFGANGELNELKDYGTLETHTSAHKPSIMSGFGGASGLIKFGPGFERDLDDMVDYL